MVTFKPFCIQSVERDPDMLRSMNPDDVIADDIVIGCLGEAGTRYHGDWIRDGEVTQPICGYKP